MSRFARQRSVFFLEDPVGSDIEALQISPCALTGVQVVMPALPFDAVEDRRAALDLLLARTGPATAWYTSPEARAFSSHVPWLTAVYDCPEETSPAGLPFEAELIEMADLVFTATPGRHENLRKRHPSVQFFPQGLDIDHLSAARGLMAEPEDQIGLRRPLLGRYAPVDDGLDLDLLARMASLRPHWHFALIGPIETDRELPKAANIHWLGAPSAAKIPAYLSHWDVAIAPLLPGAAPDSLEIPRYLAAGRRVVSTPAEGIARRFAAMGAVTIAASVEAFVAAAEEAMSHTDVADFVAVDDFLVALSWDAIQKNMAALLSAAERDAVSPGKPLSRFAPMPAFLSLQDVVPAG